MNQLRQYVGIVIGGLIHFHLLFFGVFSIVFSLALLSGVANSASTAQATERVTFFMSQVNQGSLRALFYMLYAGSASLCLHGWFKKVFLAKGFETTTQDKRKAYSTMFDKYKTESTIKQGV